jgi:hypothetical protein
MIDITFEFQNLLNIFASNWKLPLMSSLMAVHHTYMKSLQTYTNS